MIVNVLRPTAHHRTNDRDIDPGVGGRGVPPPHANKVDSILTVTLVSKICQKIVSIMSNLCQSIVLVLL